MSLELSLAKQNKTKTYGITSGFFNPLHSGHLALIEEARSMCDELIVIVNNDLQVELKGSQPFMTADERAKIVIALKSVDKVVIAIDKNKTVSKTIDAVAVQISKWGLLNSIFGESSIPNILFCKGGDRKDNSCMPQSELEVCHKYGIEVVYGVGGFDKKNSSSKILQQVPLFKIPEESGDMVCCIHCGARKTGNIR